jgi:hypothetical protein
MNIKIKIADSLNGREYIAKHPRTGLWHGIDRYLQCPITDGYVDREQAKRAWRDNMASQIGDYATRNKCLNV